MEELLPLFPPSASTSAAKVDALFFFLLGTSVFFALLIAGLVIGFAVRYRRRMPDETPAGVHGVLLLEIGWTVIPLGLSMIMFLWGAVVYFDISTPPPDAEEVYAIGKQWMWKFQHPNGRREINQLHVPVGRPIKVLVSSEDVIHSFFVPAFRVKIDAVPGRYQYTWFEATKPGTYHLFCAEYCGAEHSRMTGSVVVMEPAEYQAWLAEIPATAGSQVSPAVAGEALYTELGCHTCHRPDGTGLGPDLTAFFGTERPLQDGSTAVADEDYFRESLLNPQAKLVEGFLPVMPTLQGRVNEEQLLQLMAYVKSLG